MPNSDLGEKTAFRVDEARLFMHGPVWATLPIIEIVILRGIFEAETCSENEAAKMLRFSS